MTTEVVDLSAALAAAEAGVTTATESFNTLRLDRKAAIEDIMKAADAVRTAEATVKRAKNADELVKMISKTFKVKEMLEDPKDWILFCTN